jgi:hypothetical protein
MADITITATSVVPGANAIVEHGILGASATAGQAVYKDTSTNTFKLSDSNGASSLIKSVYGIVVAGGSSGQACAVQRAGSVTIGATLTPAAAYYLSANPGGICPFADLTTGDAVTQIGIAASASVLQLEMVAPGLTL